ncbi:hypothetical protein G5S34_15005 [Herbaspirillum frisingense]|uniref:hypothetical protein n=1 Tax=Herbaspirillum frisingense TaxID=92645 RepID=UPI0015FF7557|nr:hypothetical protein [Herbaspirillum frisingense]QNB07939.1 hypothetical protein G5S34_15005 [Herbaspirillum frisingense]
MHHEWAKIQEMPLYRAAMHRGKARLAWLFKTRIKSCRGVAAWLLRRLLRRKIQGVFFAYYFYHPPPCRMCIATSTMKQRRGFHQKLAANETSRRDICATAELNL